MSTRTAFLAFGLALTAAAATLPATATLAESPAQPGAENKEIPPDIIAVQIRRQGFPCGNAKSAKYDASDSVPNEEAWILTCDNASYRVILVPDMEARVERLH